MKKIILTKIFKKEKHTLLKNQLEVNYSSKCKA